MVDMAKKKSKKETPMPRKTSMSGKYARMLLDKEPHCRPCAQKELNSQSLAQGGGVKPLKEKYGWDLKSFGSKGADGPAKFCKKCGKNTHHDQWTGKIFEAAKGSANLSDKLKKRIRELLGPKDAFANPITDKVCYEHKSPHQRWQTGDQPHNDDMSEDEIRATFQLYPDESWNILKDRKGCRKCIQSKGKEGRVPPFEDGWPEDIPEKGQKSVEGCKGCFWYDTTKYLRKNLGDETQRVEFLNKLEEQLSKLHEDHEEKMKAISESYESTMDEIDQEYEDGVKKLDMEGKEWKKRFLKRAILTSLLFLLPGALLSFYMNQIAPFIGAIFLTWFANFYDE
jgi:hypothetical protein